MAGAIWAVHLLAIRNDARLERATPKPAQLGEAERGSNATPEERRAYLEQRKAELEQELERVKEELATL